MDWPDGGGRDEKYFRCFDDKSVEWYYRAPALDILTIN